MDPEAFAHPRRRLCETRPQGSNLVIGGSRALYPVSEFERGLLERDLIRTSIAEGDRRQRRYVLTAAGRRILDRVRRTRQTAIDVVWADLPVAELREFAQFGETLAGRLEAYLNG